MSNHGLPSRDGVTPSCVSLPAGNWPTMADFFFERFPAISAQTWLERMAQGLMVDEFGVPVDAERPYQGHIRIYYYRALAQEVRIPFEESLLFQDEYLVVADKPHFLPVTPSGSYLQETLLVRLKKRLGIDCLVPLHRIDRETAGLVLFSKRPQDRNAYQDLFRRHQMRKHYEAIAPWRAEIAFPLTRKSRIVEGEPFFRQREIDGPPNSETEIDVIAVVGNKARYKLNPVTGKKHQLRVHMYALGLAIDNDRMYPPVLDTPGDDFNFPLQLLAKGIAFTDPITGQARAFESQLKLQNLSAA
ncbi:Ribosomal large subunit pseudouridine synthase A [Polaromonas vacuolata]|uniref:Ribosomal large subunit pseudouridine synthase A n=1 Tax=Polaromonas vacuolata TaxID=37448 RepID=A0A6H2H7P4_9BURK|nr:RluA family pseudouridine synthase [Polaromonas vacuolata]QJC55813.1 Ribosomal large subunit pseudouridine synthase A [Polaromonas vacuolata]